MADITSNLNNISIEADMRDLFSVAFKLYDIAEGYKMLYKKDPMYTIPKTLINLYYSKIHPNYNDMIYNFKRKYIANELLVEKNDTKEQREGLKLVYDYIQEYPVDKEAFDIFISTMIINSDLWKFVDEKFKDDLTDRREEVKRLEEEAKAEKNIEKYKKARQLGRELEKLSTYNKIGGRFRTDSEDVHMLGLDINVPSGSEAMVFMNSFLNKDKKEEFMKYYKGTDIFAYIDYCVSITAQMIKTQPFVDGNKRTFRSLLNLMFKIRNIPPVYIKANERDEYKKALYKAMKDEDYKDLCGFYYYKICDSIYELDVKPYIDSKKFEIEEKTHNI